MIKLIDNISFSIHIVVGLLVRLLVIGWGLWFDQISEVPYTDIDYRVVTDASRHILANRSPYQRHTYRYTPLLAILLLPNTIVHHCWGKVVFSIFDIMVGWMIKLIVQNETTKIWQQNVSTIAEKAFNRKWNKISEKDFIMPPRYEQRAKRMACFWLYNPFAIVISTRGNGDSITSSLVLATLYILLKYDHKNISDFFLAGMIHGLAIHFRLYPMAFSLAYYLYASNSGCSILASIFIPNRKQLLLVLGTLFTFGDLTFSFYQHYGYEFLYETYLYHLIRKDTRHNFSLYFYMQYLSSGEVITILEKILTFLPQFLILVLTSLSFSRHFKTLPFCIFIQSFTMVAFNPVITSQYFIWFVSLLPLCWYNFRQIGVRTAIAYGLLWSLAQGAWLGPAYLLEFKGWNMFGMIWMQSVMFFGVNMFLLQRLIVNFNVIADFRLKQF